ncbi:LCP family protein, partial [Streptomyces californicus]
MGRSSTPGERTRSRVRRADRADELGWDESLYEKGGEAPGGAARDAGRGPEAASGAEPKAKR